MMGQCWVMGGLMLAMGSLFAMLILEELRDYRRWKRNHEERNRYLSGLKSGLVEMENEK